MKKFFFFLWPTSYLSSCGFLPLEMPGSLFPQRDGLDSCPKEGGERGHRTWCRTRKGLPTTPQQELQLFSFYFFTFSWEREMVVLFGKEILEKGKCACLIVCKEWGVQEGKMELSVMRAEKTAKWISDTTVHFMPSTTLLQNNPCICEIKLSKRKGKCIAQLHLICYYFFKTEVG